MKCLACEKELNRKDVVFTEDKLPYCQNPFECKHDAHPNSVTNIVARGGAVKLFSEDELEENIFERLGISDEMKDRIMKVATKPQSIRLSKYEIAYYLLALQDNLNLSSISESVRYCVNLAMKVKPIGVGGKLVPVQPHADVEVDFEESADVEVYEAVPATEEELKDTAIKQSGGISFVVPDIPKSVNVDWSKVKAAPAPEPVEKEEDEFTF